MGGVLKKTQKVTNDTWKINKFIMLKLRSFLQQNTIQIRKKTSHRLGENICNTYTDKRISI